MWSYMNSLGKSQDGIFTQDFGSSQVDLGETSVKELTVHEVYEKVAASVCKVVWKTNKDSFESTGSFVQYPDEKIHVLTCFHGNSVNWQEIEIVFEEKSFKGASLSRGLRTSLAQSRDLCLLRVPGLKISDAPGYFTITQDPSFRPGDDVYFAGFLAGQNKPVIHKGTISSRDEKTFTIDGTVIRGNSGSPVVLIQEGRLTLVGTLASQILDPKKKTEGILVDSRMNYKKEKREEAISREFDEIMPGYSRGVGRGVCITQLFEMLPNNPEEDGTVSRFFKKPVQSKEKPQRLASEIVDDDQNKPKRTRLFHLKHPEFTFKDRPVPKSVVEDKIFPAKRGEHKKQPQEFFFNSFMERELSDPVRTRVLLYPAGSKTRQEGIATTKSTSFLPSDADPSGSQN